jgi:hypothetical protein
MRRMLLVTIAFLTASGAAFAQPSQGQGGAQAGVNGNGPNAPDSAMQNDVRPSATTGMGNEAGPPNRVQGIVTNPSALAPSSEGNVGPGTNNNNGVAPGGR